MRDRAISSQFGHRPRPDWTASHKVRHINQQPLSGRTGSAILQAAQSLKTCHLRRHCQPARTRTPDFPQQTDRFMEC
ncbi:hypothetical protein Pcar_3154 [Syntrophotalea carbinolica DSM 2380]|uniref:Uncharacterized protein n=1 Tax=Syntrophotalea carbinolica (strain DSM 2380 / NBRC 103641 / GraBd1) TaxID=338963 RepID=Q0C712_SYNC1|nr:hypothetical protein Pcar_3154 [Syntrophotalea carbinolica DSM 2380]